MTTVEVVEQIAAAADAVFAELGNFRSIRTGAGVDSVDYEGDGVGMTRAIHLRNGTVLERLESYDEAARSFSYVIVNDDSPLPFASYSASVAIEDNGDGTSTVRWTGTFEPKGIAEEEAVRFARGIYGSAIQWAREALS